MRFRSSARPRSLLSLCLVTLLASCGGGSGDDSDVGPPSGTQQYPGGIWEGTVGTGTAQRTMVGFIDGGVDGKGGEFYLARGAAGSAGYDGIYGLLRTNVAAVQATGVTYFSVQDGKFATGLTLRGTASSDPATGKTVSISGNYTSPAGTAAATSSPTTFKLGLSKLNDYPARSDLVVGTYRGAGVFGGQWVFTVTANGSLSGRVGGCSVQGTVAPRSQSSALYTVTMGLSGDEIACGDRAGTQQAGVAFLRFDASNKPAGIWVLTRNAIGADNTYVLNGLKDPGPDVITPFTGPAAGNWVGTLQLPAGVTGDTAVWGSVLPDGGMFFYTNSSFNHNALYGQLLPFDNSATPTRFLSDKDSVRLFDRQLGGTGGYIGGVQFDMAVESTAANQAASRLTGSYSYSTQPGGYPTQFTLQRDPLYALPATATPNINLIVGSYRMPGVGFGGHTVDVQVAVDGAITGATTNGCLIVGKLIHLAGNDANLYRVEAFGYLEDPAKPVTPGTTIGCELSTGPSQSGVASAMFSQGRVSGLRILTSGESKSGERAHSVFVGDKR